MFNRFISTYNSKETNFFTNGLSIVVFIVFGLFIEIILTQLTIIVVLCNVGVRKQQLYRFPLNMLSFSIVSIIAAEVYLLLGGSHDATNYESLTEITAIFGYALTIFLLNQLFNKLIDFYFYRRENVRVIELTQKWELTSLFLVLPVGYVLLILYSEIGTAGIFYIGIPFVFISIILQLLYSYQELNEYLERTNNICHQLLQKLERDEIYDLYIKELTTLLPVDFAYVYTVKDDQHLLLKRFFNQTKEDQNPAEVIKKNKAFSGRVWKTAQPIRYNNKKEWQKFISLDYHQHISIESVLSVPIRQDEKIIGITTICSTERRKFEKYHLQLLDIATMYLGVALRNAKNLEMTRAKSEIDSLTQIYNYHYFENQLNQYTSSIKQSKEKQLYSLLLLDLDHFKETNDKYGHEAGNEVLHQVAARLLVHTEKNELLARYGGEEFALLMPGVDTKEAVRKAQIIRTAISDRPFVAHKHILGHSEPEEIFITASIGVATYPVHCKSLQELVRHADRAMYIGAKNRGRNRVALYEDIATS